MPEIPLYIPFVFIGTVILTLYSFYRAVRGNKVFLPVITLWLLLQATLGYYGFYTNTRTVPPRFALLVVPAVLTIIIFFVLRKGRRFIDGFDLDSLTLLHIVRIPVEVVLYLLFVYKAVPQVMTFEGANFDVLSGITAPVILYLYRKKSIGRGLLLVWNIVCLLLLLNIVVTAVLSLPLPFQKLGFEQPNVALLYFPYVWLPCCVVPLVLFSHLAAIRQLIISKP